MREIAKANIISQDEDETKIAKLATYIDFHTLGILLTLFSDFHFLFNTHTHTFSIESLPMSMKIHTYTQTSPITRNLSA